MGGGGPYVFSVTKNTFINDITSIKFNYFRYANLSKNIFIGVSRSIFMSGSEWSSTNNNTIELNQFINLDSAIELKGVYTYDQPENNFFKKNIFQTFLKNQKKSLIKTNLKINTNIFQENNFSLYDSFIIKNTDIGNVPFTGNYTMPSRTIANDIYDQNDNIDLGLVQITSPSSTPIITAPISMPIKVVKSLSAGRVVLTWTANTESDIAGYKIHYGGFTGYSYTNSVDAGNILTYTLPAGVAITEDIAVTAYDASKDGVDDQYDGNESWYSPANKAPEAPTALTADAGPRNVKLNWTASTSTGVNKYNVYKSTDGTNYTFLWSTINTYTTEETRTPGVTYYYKVTAFDSLDLSYDNYGLESPYSNVISAIPSNRIYVNRVTGNDANNGSIANPVAKLQIGVNKAENGDTVVISDHSYTERVTITGTGKTITIGSQYMFDYDSAHTIAASLDGTGFGYSHTLISSTASLIIHGITIKNMIGMGIDCSTGTILNLKNVRINNLGFNSANVFEYILNAPKIYVDSSRIYGNHDISGMFNVQDSVSFKNSKFHDNIAGLLYYSTSGQSNKAFIYNSLFSDNKTGTSVSYLVHNVRSVIIQRNKFSNNTLSLFSGSSAAYQRFENNLFYKNTSVIARGPQMSSGDSLILYHNTFLGNGTDMSFNLSGKWKGIFYNNIITSTINFNGPTPSRGDYINIDIRGNIFKTYPSFSYVDTTSSLNITRSNVLFKDTANLDFRL